jgi:hypothetical protein
VDTDATVWLHLPPDRLNLYDAETGALCVPSLAAVPA